MSPSINAPAKGPSAFQSELQDIRPATEEGSDASAFEVRLSVDHYFVAGRERGRHLPEQTNKPFGVFGTRRIRPRGWSA